MSNVFSGANKPKNHCSNLNNTNVSLGVRFLMTAIVFLRVKLNFVSSYFHRWQGQTDCHHHELSRNNLAYALTGLSLVYKTVNGCLRKKFNMKRNVPWQICCCFEHVWHICNGQRRHISTEFDCLDFFFSSTLIYSQR